MLFIIEYNKTNSRLQIYHFIVHKKNDPFYLMQDKTGQWSFFFLFSKANKYFWLVFFQKFKSLYTMFWCTCKHVICMVLIWSKARTSRKWHILHVTTLSINLLTAYLQYIFYLSLSCLFWQAILRNHFQCVRNLKVTTNPQDIFYELPGNQGILFLVCKLEIWRNPVEIKRWSQFDSNKY